MLVTLCGFKWYLGLMPKESRCINSDSPWLFNSGLELQWNWKGYFMASKALPTVAKCTTTFDWLPSIPQSCDYILSIFSASFPRKSVGKIASCCQLVRRFELCSWILICFCTLLQGLLSMHVGNSTSSGCRNGVSVLNIWAPLLYTAGGIPFRSQWGAELFYWAAF